MDIARLRALRELSSRHTMAAVADALCLTPSAVSQQISQLEQEVGVQLTERQGRGVRLTHAGEVLVGHVERLLTVLDEARSDMAAIRREIAGVLRVAAFPTAAAALLPQAMTALQADYPLLEIVVEEMEPADGLAALGSWRADLAFVDDMTLLGAQEKTVARVELLEDALYVLLPEDHRLARKASIAMAELRHERWALDSASSFYAEFVLNLCRRAGYSPIVNAQCRGFEIIAAMVSSGCSISVVPGLRRMQQLPRLTAVKLRPEVKRRIAVAYRRGEHKHPAVQVFLEAVTRCANAIGT